MMRTESNHARGTFHQLRIALLGGLTCNFFPCITKLNPSSQNSRYVQQSRHLSHHPLTVSQLEVDKQQLNTESGASALVPGPADGKHIS